MTVPRSFQPDLIVEATTVCDRQCQGCYAPNIISRENPLKLLSDRPELFLAAERLEDTISSLIGTTGSVLKVIGVRGGEPTRHPSLPDILRTLAKKTEGDIYLESHGRWTLDGADHTALFSAILESNTTVKLSFDKMHGLSATDLETVTTALNDRGIKWCVAITEPDEASFYAARERCAWIIDESIIYQPKADSATGLARPRCAVIRVNGSLSGELTVRPEFRQSKTPRTVETGAHA